ncbi:Uncharacterized protein FWK35_00019365 [Aphis craccivora]|uniref:Uncharacterized protein n=1 Tax=Aphis craccivora TaxID=307492 RepID=A0A6G0ZA95_APHCR|nr:Uncharacterized protein FWK35_00019365 [Aphis craccivora]
MQPARSALNYRARYRHVRHYRAAHDKTRAAAYFKTSTSDNSERSDECIDFTMMCVCFFFVSVYSITSRNNTQISNFEGDFRCKSEYPWCIIEVKSKYFPTVFKKIEKNKKKKKNDGKTGIFTQNQFSTKTIFLRDCYSKTNHYKYLKFSPNGPYEFSNFYEICRKRENLQYKSYILEENILTFFEYQLNFFGPMKILEDLIQIQILTKILAKS